MVVLHRYFYHPSWLPSTGAQPVIIALSMFITKSQLFWLLLILFNRYQVHSLSQELSPELNLCKYIMIVSVFVSTLPYERISQLWLLIFGPKCLFGLIFTKHEALPLARTSIGLKICTILYHTKIVGQLPDREKQNSSFSLCNCHHGRVLILPADLFHKKMYTYAQGDYRQTHVIV